MSQGVLERLFSPRKAYAQELPVNDVDPQLEEEEDRSFEYALEALPCNAMFCDRELILRYLNRSSRKTFYSAEVSPCARRSARG